MPKPVTIADLLELSVAERIQLVEDLWDSIAAVPEALPLTDAQREELDRRLDAYRRDPSAGFSSASALDRGSLLSMKAKHPSTLRMSPSSLRTVLRKS